VNSVVICKLKNQREKTTTMRKEEICSDKRTLRREWDSTKWEKYSEGEKTQIGRPMSKNAVKREEVLREILKKTLTI